MKRMKFFTLALGLCMLSSIALAENPANWTFTEEQIDHGVNFNWKSSTAVDNTFNHYDYTYEITSVLIDFSAADSILVSGLGWQDAVAWGFIDSSMLTGSGGGDGVLPLSMSSTTISQQGTESVGIASVSYDFQATLTMSVDENGYGHIDVVDPVLLLDGNATSMKISGTMGVTGSQVPEPCTMAILGAAGVAVLARKRRK